MKKLLVVLSLAVLAGCGPKVVDTFVVDADLKFLVYDELCKLEDVKDAARGMGAPESDVAKFKSATVKSSGEKDAKACVHYFSKDQIFAGDELGRAGMLSRQSSK